MLRATSSVADWRRLQEEPMLDSGKPRTSGRGAVTVALANLSESEVMETCARCLYGEGWRSPLAEALGVSERSLRYWMANERPIPPGIWVEIRGLLIAHSL